MEDLAIIESIVRIRQLKQGTQSHAMRGVSLTLSPPIDAFPRLRSVLKHWSKLSWPG